MGASESVDLDCGWSMGLRCGGGMRPGRWLVYVAGPYSHGDVVLNVRAAVLAGFQIKQAGHLAFVPHYFHFGAYLLPVFDYEQWMDVDLGMLRRCDALVRLPGHSPGSDREVELAKTLGMPVWLSMAECLNHLSGSVRKVGAA